MSDPKLRAIASITNYIKFSAFNAGDVMPSMIKICVCKLVEMTLKYGLNEFSGISVAALEIAALMVQQDYELANKTMQMAMSIQEERGKTRTSEVLYTTHAFERPWLKPLRDSLNPMRMAYTSSGVKKGEMDHGIWGLIANVIMIPYALGNPIGLILAECAGVLARTEEAKQMGQALPVKVFWQMMSKERN